MCGRARTYGNGGNVEGICTRTPEMLAEQEVYEAGEEDGRGIAFQVCPNRACRAPGYLSDGCVRLPNITLT